MLRLVKESKYEIPTDKRGAVWVICEDGEIRQAAHVLIGAAYDADVGILKEWVPKYFEHRNFVSGTYAGDRHSGKDGWRAFFQTTLRMQLLCAVRATSGDPPATPYKSKAESPWRGEDAWRGKPGVVLVQADVASDDADELASLLEHLQAWHAGKELDVPQAAALAGAALVRVFARARPTWPDNLEARVVVAGTPAFTTTCSFLANLRRRAWLAISNQAVLGKIHPDLERPQYAPLVVFLGSDSDSDLCLGIPMAHRLIGALTEDKGCQDVLDLLGVMPVDRKPQALARVVSSVWGSVSHAQDAPVLHVPIGTAYKLYGKLCLVTSRDLLDCPIFVPDQPLPFLRDLPSSYEWAQARREETRSILASKKSTRVDGRLHGKERLVWKGTLHPSQGACTA